MLPLVGLLLAGHAQAESFSRLLCINPERPARRDCAAQYAIEKLLAALLFALVVFVSVHEGGSKQFFGCTGSAKPLTLFLSSIPEQGAEGQLTQPEALADRTGEAGEPTVKVEPAKSESWCLMPGADARPRIASRCSTPHEARSVTGQHGSRPLRRSRIHCPSAV